MKTAKLMVSLLLVSGMACAMEQDNSWKKEEEEKSAVPSLKDLCARKVAQLNLEQNMLQITLPQECNEEIVATIPKIIRAHPVYKYILGHSWVALKTFIQELKTHYETSTEAGRAYYRGNFKNVCKILEKYKGYYILDVPAIINTFNFACLMGHNGVVIEVHDEFFKIIDGSSADLYQIPDTASSKLIHLFDNIWQSNESNSLALLTEEQEIEFNKLPEQAKMILKPLVKKTSDYHEYCIIQ